MPASSLTYLSTHSKRDMLMEMPCDKGNTDSAAIENGRDKRVIYIHMATIVGKG